MNNEAKERLVKQLGRIGMACFSFSFLHTSLRGFEKDPNKPFSAAVAFFSVGYVVFQLADAFAQVKNPRSAVFDYISIFCGVAVIFIALVGIFCIVFFN